MQVVGVSLDDAGSEQAVTKFTKDFGMKYDVLSGNSSLADIYGGVPFLPQSFFIDRTGIIRKTTVGVITKADLESAAKELLIAGDRMYQLVPADPR
jgi:peroxiredoxin